MSRGGGERGTTLTELVVACAVLTILAGVAYPAVKYTQRRAKESELRQDLREMRAAIDEYKRYSDAGLLPVELGSDGYPPDLETLVEGVDVIGQVDKKAKFLRRIPVDPMTGEDKWGLRSYQDDIDSTSWGGEDVFDVYSLSAGVGLNKIAYSKW
ncbi:MAG: type II secretion system protein [Thermoanaerobaculia bacterium]